jgi:hypothetical protein
MGRTLPVYLPRLDSNPDPGCLSRVEAEDSEELVASPSLRPGFQERAPVNSLCLDAAFTCALPGPGTCASPGIIEVPAASGSNQLPLEEVAWWPPDADAQAVLPGGRSGPAKAQGAIPPHPPTPTPSQPGGQVFCSLPFPSSIPSSHP